VAEETIEQEEFEKMFADLPDPRKDTHITPQPLAGPMARPEGTPAPTTAPKPSPQPA
jgi:hypothetical protein